MNELFFPSGCHPAPSRRQFLALGAALVAAARPFAASGASSSDGVDIIREHARSPRDPWAVCHAVRAMGRDFTLEGGRRAVDFLLEDQVASVTLNGRTVLAFPRQVEVHPNSFLKTLLEAGVPTDYGFTHKGQRRTVADLVDGARWTFKPQDVMGRPNELPWSLIAFSLTTSPLKARWTNAWGQPVDLDAVVGNALEMLERASAPVAEAMAAGRPLTARAPVHHLTCGGTHLIYSIITAAHAGFAQNGRMSRVKQQIDVLVWRLVADIDLINRFYAERNPGTALGPWLHLSAKLKLLGHAEECLALATHRKVAVLSTSHQAKRQKAVTQVRELFDETDAKGLSNLLALDGTAGPRPQIDETYRQLVGDVCHARHGLTLS